MSTLHTHSDTKDIPQSHLSVTLLIPLFVFALVMVLIYLAYNHNREVTTVSNTPTSPQITTPFSNQSQSETILDQDSLKPRL